MNTSFDWTCTTCDGRRVLEETCSGCGHWQCVKCRTIVPPKSGCTGCHLGKLKDLVDGQTTRLTIFHAGLEGLWLESADGGERSQSHLPEADPPDPDPLFALDVGRAATIRWELHGSASAIEDGLLELTRDDDPDAVLWSKTLTGAEVAELQTPWEGVTGLAPGEGPYVLTLTLRPHEQGKKKRLRPDRAWTRFQVAYGWIEISLEDDAGQPVGGEPYAVELPDETVLEGVLDLDGRARLEGIPKGVCQVRFPRRDGGSWGRFTPWLELELCDEDDRPVPDEPYRVELPDGSVREGRLDAQGFARLDGVARGTCLVSFPRLDANSWSRA